MEDTQETVAPPTPAKSKKPRTEAQQEATRKALLALEAKRKQSWEEKKEKLLKEQKELKSVAPVVPAPAEPTLKPEVQKKPAIKLPIVPPRPVQDNIPEWAKALSDKIDMVASNIKPKKVKKVVIEEESSSSEEEVIIRRKKEKTAPAPVAKPEEPINYLRNILMRR